MLLQSAWVYNSPKVKTTQKFTDGSMEKQNVVHPEILTPATTWMNPEDVILSEIIQTQKHKYCLILLTGGP